MFSLQKVKKSEKLSIKFAAAAAVNVVQDFLDRVRFLSFFRRRFLAKIGDSESPTAHQNRFFAKLYSGGRQLHTESKEKLSTQPLANESLPKIRDGVSKTIGE